MKRELGARPDVIPLCHAERKAASFRATALDGLYRMTTNADELAHAPGILPEDVVPENWGEFTFALARGRLAFTTENAKACVWAYGRYTVKGDVLGVTFHHQGGGRPQRRHIHAHAHTQISLEPISRSPPPAGRKPRVSAPTPWVVNQWRRVGSARWCATSAPIASRLAMLSAETSDWGSPGRSDR